MKEQKKHLYFAALLAVSYAAAGYVFFDVYSEYLLLASLLVLFTGMLPDIDGGNGAPTKELGGVLATAAPLLLLEYYPTLRAGGIARVALIVLCSYLLVRLLVVEAIQKLTKPRGMVHSVPAAILSFEIAYMLFWDLFYVDRIFLAGAAFIGYFSHLLVDAYGNLDLWSRAMGKAEVRPPVLKFWGRSVASTLAMYTGVIGLGWFVARDFYPPLRTLF